MFVAIDTQFCRVSGTGSFSFLLSFFRSWWHTELRRFHAEIITCKVAFPLVVFVNNCRESCSGKIISWFIVNHQFGKLGLLAWLPCNRPDRSEWCNSDRDCQDTTVSSDRGHYMETGIQLKSWEKLGTHPLILLRFAWHLLSRFYWAMWCG